MPEFLPIKGEKIRNLTNQVFGMLTALGAVGRDNRGKYIWQCRCECGKLTEKTSNGLVQGMVRSCGCASIEMSRLGRIKHGQAIGGKRTPEFQVWHGMLARCQNPKGSGYKNYGGRGIKVCERWKTFENFKEDMGSKPPGMSIDRIDVNGDYCKENCLWSNWQDQMNNRRNNVTYTAFGVTGTLPHLCRHFQKPFRRVAGRIWMGWDIEKALMLPSKKQPKQP
jgi:hypothetical protein